MAVAIIEQINQNILTSLNDVSTNNGTLKVVREKRWKNDPADMKGILYQLSSEKLNDTFPYVSWRQHYLLETYIEVSESDNETKIPDAILNDIEAAITKILLTDINRGGFALKTEMEASEPFSVGTHYDGRDINFFVEYRTQYNDPYSQ